MDKPNPRGMKRLGSLLGAILLSANVFAGDIRIESTWVRASAPGQDFAMADMTLVSMQDATLTGASSPIAESVALHGMTHENGMMRMREVETLALPAGERVNLGESGYHLMLNGLKSPIKAGDTVQLLLTIARPGERAEQIEARAEVRPLTATRKESHEDKSMHHHH